MVCLAAIAVELLGGFLILSTERFDHTQTKVAICIMASAWILSATITSSQLTGSNSPSVLWKFKVGVLLAIWGILSGVVMLIAVQITLKWLLGLHAVIAILLMGVTAVLRGAAQHIDFVDAGILDSADMHTQINHSATAARLGLNGLSINSAITRRARTAIDRDVRTASR